MLCVGAAVVDRGILPLLALIEVIQAELVVAVLDVKPIFNLPVQLARPIPEVVAEVDLIMDFMAAAVARVLL
jgi:hypothetical protein